MRDDALKYAIHHQIPVRATVIYGEDANKWTLQQLSRYNRNINIRARLINSIKNFILEQGEFTEGKDPKIRYY